ncbi:winged helix-turn-helix transcriptional regulator [Phormidesmis sp. 146-12]
MLSIFQTTGQGKQTRSQVIETLKQRDGLTRNELAEASGLSYEQVRSQTANLISEGAIVPSADKGKRRYYLRLVALLLAGWLPFCGASIEEDSISDVRQELSDS